MTLRVELHDCSMFDPRGTHHDNVDCLPDQLGSWIHNPPSKNIKRAYIVSGGSVVAVLKISSENTPKYVGKNINWQGENLPFVDPEVKEIAYAVLGLEVKSDEDAFKWAREALRVASTAVLLDLDDQVHRVRAAWELYDGEPTPVVRSPNFSVELM